MMTAIPDENAFKLCFCTIKPFTALARWRFQRILNYMDVPDKKFAERSAQHT